jgi:hypothetical protein
MTTSLCRLDALADIKLGVKTFINEFFYVQPPTVTHFGIESQFLEPVFRTADVDRSVFLQAPAATKESIFLCNTTLDKLVGTGAAAYIKWAERQHYPTRNGRPGGLWKDTPAAKGDKRVWYQNQAMPPAARIVMPKLADDILAPLILAAPMRVDQSFNQINARSGVDEDILIGLLCSTFVAMSLETFGRTAMGQGALQVPTETLRGLLVPDIRGLPTAASKKLKTVTQGLLRSRRVGVRELGKSKPLRALDAEVLKLLGFASSRLNELYADTLALREVRSHLAKGRTRIKRERFQSDLAQVAKDVAVQLRTLTQGKRFPRDFLPSGTPGRTVQLGNAPLHVEGELLLGQRRVIVSSAGSTVFDQLLPASTGELMLRGLQAGQRLIDLPSDDAASEAALLALAQLIEQLEFKLTELTVLASPSQHSAIQSSVEADLNFPIKLLGAPLPATYAADL